MSSDFEVAIEEGATVVRIGTALFGRRETAQASKEAPPALRNTLWGSEERE
jgi:hypothetical protein